MTTGDDISRNFKPNPKDSMVIQELLKYEGTPQAILFFARMKHHLSDYAYWFMLGNLWVSYTGWSDLEVWRILFKADRQKRASSIMKPSELEALKQLPEIITVYRAHRPGETDWISYTLDPVIAGRFARERSVSEVMEYKIRKKDVVALFLRRGEKEIIMLEPRKKQTVRKIDVIVAGEET